MIMTKEGLSLAKDGIVDINEAKKFMTNPDNIKLILWILVSVLFNPLIAYLKQGLNTGSWMADGLFDVAGMILPIVLIGYYFKGLFDKSFSQNTEKDRAIKRLEEEKNEMKLSHQFECNKYELQIKQMEGILALKNWEIERVSNHE